MIVIDASAALSGLLNDGPARRSLATEQVHAPHLVDAEIASGLRRRVSARQLTAALSVETLSLPEEICRALDDVSAPVHRYPDHDWSTL